MRKRRRTIKVIIGDNPKIVYKNMHCKSRTVDQLDDNGCKTQQVKH